MKRALSLLLALSAGCVSFTRLTQDPLGCTGPSCTTDAEAPAITTVRGDASDGRVVAGVVVEGVHLASVTRARLLPVDKQLIIDQASDTQLALAFDERDRTALSSAAAQALTLELTNAAGSSATPLSIAFGANAVPPTASCGTAQVLQGVGTSLTCVPPVTSVTAVQRTVAIGINSFVAQFDSTTFFKPWHRSFTMYRGNNTDQTTRMAAPIPVPDGATLDEVTCMINDGTGDSGAPSFSQSLQMLVYAHTDTGVVACLLLDFSEDGQHAMTQVSSDWATACRQPVQRDLSLPNTVEFSLELKTSATPSLGVFGCHARYTTTTVLP